MKVLLHCVYYPPEIGGLESHVAGLAEELVGRGHEVRVVTSRSRPDLARNEEKRGVGLERTPLPARTPPGWVAFAVGSIPATLRHAKWADIVHAQAFASVVPAGIAAERLGRPWLASFHTSHFLMRARRRAWRPALRRLVRWPDFALAASREIADVARDLAPGTRVEALTNGVDTDRFHPPHARTAEPGAPTLIVPRRLFRKNGVEHLVRAVPGIRVRFPGIRVRIVGDGPERARLEALATDLGVAGAIRFEGSVSHDEMPERLARADLAIFPSLMEATSVAALEAMACGLPVVATRVGGLPEIVDESVGALVPPADPGAIAAAVIGLLDSDELARRGARARSRVVHRWSNARLVARHLEIYEDLRAGRPVREPTFEGTTP